MTHRPRLTRSIPFWALAGASVVTAATGLWLVVDRLGTMAAVLTDGSATPLDVYGGQSWALVGAAILAAGIVGLFVTLALAAASSLVRRAPVAEPIAAEPIAAETLDVYGTDASVSQLTSKLRLRREMLDAERRSILDARREGRYQEPAIIAALQSVDAEETALRAQAPEGD